MEGAGQRRGGTVIRLKPVALSAIRIDGKYDNDGNPMYAVQAGQAMATISPDHLRHTPEGQQDVKGVQ